MFSKVIILISCLTVTYASVAAPLLAPAPIVRAAPYDPLPQYSFGYDVQDTLTGDFKNQQESRNGDVVQGSYSVIDPDGTRRVVLYSADPINGFNAVVKREPLVVPAPVVAKVAPVAHLAPVAPVAPVAHVAPVAPVAPLARLAAPLAFGAPFAAPLALGARYAHGPVLFH